MAPMTKYSSWLIGIALLVSPHMAFAEEGYSDLVLSDPNQIFHIKTDTNGKVQEIRLNMELLDQKLQALWRRAGDYPPKFSGSKEQEEAVRLLRFLINIVDTVKQDFEADGEMALRAGMLYAMAFNLNLPEAASRSSPQELNARHYYELAVKFNPNDPHAHLYLGNFLCSADAPQEGVAHLEKAVALGLTPARYSLGLCYLMVGDKARAIEQLERYLEADPSNQQARDALTAIRSGRVEDKR